MLPRGVLLRTESFASPELISVARDIEGLGFESLWLPELFGREPFATSGYLLGKLERIAVATGIANVYARDAIVAAQARYTLAETSGGRFLLGLGVSNAALNASRGHAWQPPLTKLRSYLEVLNATRVEALAHVTPAPVHIAAHGPALQRLGAASAAGVITYLMTVEHTRISRARLGAAPGLSVFAAFIAETDPVIARSKARTALAMYIGLDYYRREWRKLGFDDADFASGGSDRLIDAVVAHGDAAALQARVAEHERAGASRVVVLPLGLVSRGKLTMDVLQAVAPVQA